MKICIITVDHGKPELTSSLYFSVVNQASSNVEVHFVVLENSGKVNENKYDFLNSTKGKNISNEVQFLKNDGYFGTASNYLKNNKFDHYSWIIVCNNDLSLDVNFFSTLANRQIDISDKFLICPSIFEKNKNINPLSQKKYPQIKKIFWDFYYRYYFFALCYEVARIPISKFKFYIRTNITNISASEGEIYLGYGAIYLINPVFINTIGELPAKTFLYQEESVICGYARSFGNWPYFLPTLKVYHESHSTLRYIGFDKDYELRRGAWWATRKLL